MTKAKQKTAIKRARAKLHKARSAAKSGQPGTAERVKHHTEVVQRLVGTPAVTGAPSGSARAR